MDSMNDILELAIGAHRAGDALRAESAYRAFLSRSPDHHGASAMLGQLLTETNRRADAIALLEPIVREHPRAVQARFRLAMALLGERRDDEAIDHLREAVRQRDPEPQLHFWLGAALERTNRRREAERCFREAMSRTIDEREPLRQLALQFHQIGRPELSAECLERVLERRPDDVDSLLKLAGSFRLSRQNERAIRALESALTHDPTLAAAHAAIADLHERGGRVDLARHHAMAALESEPRNLGLIAMLARLDRRDGRAAEAAERLGRALRSAGPTQPGEAAARVELGHVLDAMGEYATAFESVASGKQLAMGPPGRIDLGAYPSRVARRGSQYPPEVMRGWPARPPEGAGQAPAFLMGFPRSGTTLTEQVLSSHPRIVTTDEAELLDVLLMAARERAPGPEDDGADLEALTDTDVLELRAMHTALAERSLGAGSIEGRVVVDKLPLNTINLPVVRRVFPDAKVLFALRDPRDVCVSCFFQWFELNAAMAQFHSIESTAELYASVMGLWLKWRGEIGLESHETRYEDLVEDLEGAARRIIGFLDLEWTADLLQFHERGAPRTISTPSFASVREPLHARATQRWRHYARQLEPVRERLAPFVSAFGYQD
ncbi:MAG: sulfotransferase [Phycisphaeraceae bacterium]|nr:sulfotransferase [Phycisphaeraceae bacterium]